MALAPRLNTVEGVFRKLQREMYRAFHHRDMTHKADHFLNFCVTAHSLRDYLLERLELFGQTNRRPLEARWSSDPLMQAVADIANTAKHFQLRYRKSGQPRIPGTRQVRRGRTSLMNVFINAEGEVKVEKKTNVPTYYVELSDGVTYEMYRFMDSVEQYWRAELKSHGIKPRRQPWKRLSGAAA